jgi:acetyl-CoA/propionyl-CoA carboxylase biotin carboxyl carrier protein
VVAVGTRDCSLQRRNQKLVEEAPAPFLSDEVRKKLHDAAIAICKEAGYVSAGTVEFLLAPDGMISFLEVNTRLQVEHSVTEQVYGVDLVTTQFKVAEGAPLDIPDDLAPTGHAIEFRVLSEDPGSGFMPSVGQIDQIRFPAGPGVRVDSGIYSGSVVSVYFDSMLAKLIFRGRDRNEAMARARRGLKEMMVSGVSTVLELDRKIARNPEFTAEDGNFGVYTTYVENELLPALKPDPNYVSNPTEAKLSRFVMEVNGRRVILGLPRLILAGLGNVDEGVDHLQMAEQSTGVVRAPIAGVISKFQVQPGYHVEAGQEIAIIEALKMGLSIYAPKAGTLGEWQVKVNEHVEADTELVTIN